MGRELFYMLMVILTETQCEMMMNFLTFHMVNQSRKVFWRRRLLLCLTLQSLLRKTEKNERQTEERTDNHKLHKDSGRRLNEA